MADMFGTIGAIGAVFMSDKALKSDQYNDFEKMLLGKIKERAERRLDSNGIHLELAQVDGR